MVSFCFPFLPTSADVLPHKQYITCFLVLCAENAYLPSRSLPVPAKERMYPKEGAMLVFLSVLRNHTAPFHSAAVLLDKNKAIACPHIPLKKQNRNKSSFA